MQFRYMASNWILHKPRTSIMFKIDTWLLANHYQEWSARRDQGKCACVCEQDCSMTIKLSKQNELKNMGWLTITSIYVSIIVIIVSVGMCWRLSSSNIVGQRIYAKLVITNNIDPSWCHTHDNAIPLSSTDHLTTDPPGTARPTVGISRMPRNHNLECAYGKESQ